MEDQANPFFLHQADGPGMVLMSQVLTSDNYGSWSKAIIVALSVKNKLGFVGGSIPQPDPDADPPQLFATWKHNNNVVISWIYNSISKDLIPSIMFSSSAHEIWNDLCDRFQRKNGPRILQLRKQLMSRTQGFDSVSLYYTKLKSI